jgi:hypothetical protein
MHRILVIRLYFLLDALHVSDCVSPSSGATFISCTSHLVYAGTIRLAVVWLYSNHKNFVHLVGLRTYSLIFLFTSHSLLPCVSFTSLISISIDRFFPFWLLFHGFQFFYFPHNFLKHKTVEHTNKVSSQFGLQSVLVIKR